MGSALEARDLSGPGLKEGGRGEPLAGLDLRVVVSRGSGLNRRGGGGEEVMMILVDCDVQAMSLADAAIYLIRSTRAWNVRPDARAYNAGGEVRSKG